MSSPAGRLYRFGVFEADLTARKLLRKGSPVRLQEQPFRVLCMLLEKSGQPVTREELRQSLWPSDTYVDFDGSLNAALKKLRFALGDSARNPSFIETLPKQGYRFIAPVAVEISRNGQASLEPETSPPSRRHWRYAVITVAGAVVLHQIVYWFLPLPGPRMINRVRLTRIGNVNPGPIVSDGTRIFFCARRGARIFPEQTSINGGDTVELKTPFQNSTILDISPDRTTFLLGSQERIGDNFKFWAWPVQGGPARRLGDLIGWDGAWSPDGRQIAYAGDHALRVANSDGSAPRMLTGRHAYRIVWSRDGRKILFSSWDPVMQIHSLWEIGSDGSHLRQVFPGDESADDISAGFWLRDSKYLAYQRGSFPHQQLWMVRQGRSFWRRNSPRPVYVPIGADDTENILPLDPHGSRLISVGYWPADKLYQLSANCHTLVPVTRFPSALNLHFSPDGKYVAYAKTGDGSLWRCRPDGTDCAQLTPAMGVLEPRWSPTGAQILFADSQPRRIRHFYLAAADAPSPPREIGPLDLEAGVADWSPDGKQIVANMSLPSPAAPEHLYLIDAASGSAIRVPGSEGFFAPAWSRDGRWIAAMNAQANQIFLYRPEQRDWLPGPAGTRFTYSYWAYRSTDLFYQDSGEAGQPIYRFNPATGKKRLAFTFREALDKDAVTCRFCGIGTDDSLYGFVLASTADLFAVDLDLP